MGGEGGREGTSVTVAWRKRVTEGRVVQIGGEGPSIVCGKPAEGRDALGWVINI